jgi:P27 family predicted phage terminase small subunit
MNRPKPTALKVLEGNLGKRPLNDKEPRFRNVMPEAPEWLNDVAKQEWEREGKLLFNAKVLTEADRGVFAMRCYIYSQILKLTKEIEEQDYVAYTQKMDSLGNEVMEAKANPRAVRLENYLKEYRQYGSLLGLDTASRTKIKVERGVPDDPMEKLLNK